MAGLNESDFDPVEAFRRLYPGRTLPPASGVELIRQHFYILLSVAPGEFAENPDYGCALYKFLDREPTPALLEEIRATVEAAVTRFEPLADLTGTEVHLDPNSPELALIACDLRERRTGTRCTFVYPFPLRLAPPDAGHAGDGGAHDEGSGAAPRTAD